MTFIALLDINNDLPSSKLTPRLKCPDDLVVLRSSELKQKKRLVHAVNK